LICLAAVYWGLIASDRYVSETNIVVDRTDLSINQGVDLGSLIAGSGGRSPGDMLLLRDHLQSVDMLNKLQARLDLRAHYSGKSHDLLSRMWSADVAQEFFHRHYLRRTSIEMDESAGVLRIRAQAYDAPTAQAITKALLEEGEAFMNEMGHRLAREQVAFLENQVIESGERALRARSKLLNYQNETGLISPQAKAESLAAIAARLEGQISELKARRAAMLGYLSPQAADVAQIALQITALENQLLQEQTRLAAPQGSALNKNIEQYQRLEMEATFAQDVYRTSLVGLEKGRLEAGRTLKKLSVLQSPTLPEYPLEPQRLYDLLVFALTVLALAGIVHLLAAIVRDHND
jgi:capsular polysaccharide transport system permease protein